MTVVLSLGLSACGGSDDSLPSAQAGKWTTGDFHVHTTQSSDAGPDQTLDLVLSKAFSSYGMDWMAVSNHLRLSPRDNNGVALSPAIPFSTGMALYEMPRIAALQAAGVYTDKLIFSGFEWDIPTHDHMGIGIFEGTSVLASAPRAVNEFEYLFTPREAELFDPADVAVWRKKYGDQRFYSSSADALKAISWLKDNYPDNSYAILNHPSRKTGSYTAADFRQFNDLAPNIMFTIEGMVGNQMEPDRGGYDVAYIPENFASRTYGGVDYVVAQVGGVWDALLGEGRRIWTVADSDSHFKTTTEYSSGYFPGEYAKTHISVQGDGVRGLVDGMRAGKSFSVFGDLINALDFSVANQAGKKEMGEELTVAAGDKMVITIRFKSPEKNNYEKPIDSGISAGVKPQVDHVDLIAGDVSTKAAPGTAAYNVAVNSSTRVLKRFTSADWKTDADGYNVITYPVTASKSQYFRLRGTNLAMDVPGKMQNGEPLADQKTTTVDNQTRFNDINDRNYGSLWFYSNPVFVSLK